MMHCDIIQHRRSSRPARGLRPVFTFTAAAGFAALSPTVLGTTPRGHCPFRRHNLGENSLGSALKRGPYDIDWLASVLLATSAGA